MADSTYSFLGSTGTFTHPDFGIINLTGPFLGVGEVTFSYTTENTVQNISSDGAVMTSFIPGDNGTIQFSVQQTSGIHGLLLGWRNLCYTNGILANLAPYAVGVFFFQGSDGRSHTATGVAPGKIPDKVYGSQGAMVSWSLMASHIIST